MKIFTRKMTSALMGTALCALSFAPSAMAVSYTAKDLGDFYSTALNASGQVAGVTSFGHPFITGANGVGRTKLGSLGGNWTNPLGINDAGQVVGTSTTSESLDRPFITGPNGVGMTDLLAGRRATGTATGINAAGQVIGWYQSIIKSDVGEYWSGFGPKHAFITGPNGMGLTDIPALEEGRDYIPFDINDSGQVTGWASQSYLDSRAFITGPNGVGKTTLSHPDGRIYPYAINNRGQLTGSFFQGDIAMFITGPNGVGMDISDFSQDARDINDAGQVVGHFYSQQDHENHGYVTGPDGRGRIDLNSLVKIDGVILKDALAINNRGQIIAIANRHSYLLRPIPEPSMWALAVAGLGVLGLVKRRKRKSAPATGSIL